MHWGKFRCSDACIYLFPLQYKTFCGELVCGFRKVYVFVSVIILCDNHSPTDAQWPFDSFNFNSAKYYQSKNLYMCVFWFYYATIMSVWVSHKCTCSHIDFKKFAFGEFNFDMHEFCLCNLMTLSLMLFQKWADHSAI